MPPGRARQHHNANNVLFYRYVKDCPSFGRIGKYLDFPVPGERECGRGCSGSAPFLLVAQAPVSPQRMLEGGSFHDGGE
jgi:hypothetical protein